MYVGVIAVLAVLIAYQQYMLYVQSAARTSDVERLLARISTEPRIVLSAPSAPDPVPTPEVAKYVSDEPYHDEMWNDFRGEPEESE